MIQRKQPFYGIFFWDCLDEPVPGDTFTHSHPLITINRFFYHLPSTAIRSKIHDIGPKLN